MLLYAPPLSIPFDAKASPAPRFKFCLKAHKTHPIPLNAFGVAPSMPSASLFGPRHLRNPRYATDWIYPADINLAAFCRSAARKGLSFVLRNNGLLVRASAENINFQTVITDELQPAPLWRFCNSGAVNKCAKYVLTYFSFRLNVLQ